MRSKLIISSVGAEAEQPTPPNTSQAQGATNHARDFLVEPFIPWPDPTLEQLTSPEFEAIWQCIKRWDINVPDAYNGYCGATGNHVRAILDALAASHNPTQSDCGAL